MAESIFVRVQRVVTASAESAVDTVERASGASLMREAIREAERAAEEVRAQHEAAGARRAHAARQQQLLRERLATLDEQARFALGKGREDLAAAVVARQIEHEAQIKQMKAAEADARDEQKRLEECMAEVKVRKSQMEKELAAFYAAQREAAAAAPGPLPADLRAERKVARAEAAFERAMNAAGGPGVGLAGAGEAAKLAEVQALQKDAEIEQRLAALRAAQAAGAGAKPKKAAARSARRA